MRNLILILIVLVVVFIFYYIYVSTKLFKWSFELKNIIPRSLDKVLSGGASADIYINIILNNPSIFGFKLRDLNISLFHNGNIVTTTPVPISLIRINSNEETQNEVILKVPMTNELLVVANKYLRKETLKMNYIIYYKIFIFEVKNEGSFEYVNNK